MPILRYTFLVRRVAQPVLAVMMSLVVPSIAVAAPFCLSFGNGASTECIYDDGASCQRDAARQNAACTVNPQVSVPSGGLGSYCVVFIGNGARCGYADGNVCAHDAQLQHGVCTKATGQPVPQTPNDYAPTAGQ